MRLPHFFACLLFIVSVRGTGTPSQSFAHDVGEPTLQNLPVWRECCGNGDCVPQHVQISGSEPGKKKIDVEIEGVSTSVDKEKFSPVPSNRSWVCYMSPGGAIRNENIRCILYPHSGGTN
jgi:hypothetical protein